MMLKKLTLLIFICITSHLTAQTATHKDLELIENQEQVDAYLEEKKSNENKLIIFNQDKHKSVLAKELFNLSSSGVKVIKNEHNKTYYKVVEKTKDKYYRVSYIALNNKDLTPDKIELLQEKIILQYENGAPFDFLVNRYSTDKSAVKGGDTGWFTKEDNNSKIEDVVINDSHELNDIFTINIPTSNEYYIILKTHEPKNIAEIKVLKIVEPID